MELLRKCLRSVWLLPVGEKLGLLLVMNCLDKNLERAYARLRLEQDCKSLSVISCDNHQEPVEWEQIDYRTFKHFPLIQSGFKHYITVSNYIHLVAQFKWLLVAIILETKLLPIGWSCYLPGRMFLHEIAVDNNYIISLAIGSLILSWRYVTNRMGNNYELLNTMIFLQTQDKLVGREVCQVRAINYKNRLLHRDNVRAGSGELASILQRVLFYKLTTADGLIVYRLRPNRTRHYKRQLRIYTDRFYIIMMILFVSFPAIFITAMLGCWLDDSLYRRMYPTCCEQPRIWWMMAPGELATATESGGDFVACGQRSYTMAFDFLDSATILISGGLIYVPTFFLSTLITGCLVLHWKLIDARIRWLFRRYEQRRFRTRRGTHLRFRRTSNRLFMSKRRKWALEEDQLLELDKTELQTLIIDFFDSFRKINRLTGTLIGYTFLLFFNGIVSFAYLSVKTANYYETFLAKYLLVALYAMFFANSIMVLELNRVINRSYSTICSLMAADGTVKAMKWIQIVDVYANRLDTSYSVLGWRLNWRLISSLAASSISFLILVETYKNRSSEFLRK